MIAGSRSRCWAAFRLLAGIPAHQRERAPDIDLPALDSLRQEFRDTPFDLVGLNDDVDLGAARTFLDDHGFSFLVAFGHGRIKEAFHAPGLPVTVLVDRDGREVHRWIGYSGPGQIAAIRKLVRAELDRVPSTGADDATAHHHHGS